jgi:vesicle transport protein SEC22
MYKQCCLQSLLKKFSQQPSHQAARLSVESGTYTFHYLIDAGVCYLTLTEKGYPKKLAFQYLEELSNEFSRLYGPQVHTVSRPYAFIKFGECGRYSRCRRVDWGWRQLQSVLGLT